MKGYIFDSMEVELDPRVATIYGSWGKDGTGAWRAGDWNLVRFFFEKMREYERPVVLDIGASTGSFCLLPLFHPAEVYAFEPHPEAFPVLQANVELNGLSSCVHTFQCALSNQTGKMPLITPPEPDRFSLATLGDLHENVTKKDRQLKVEVDVTRLDSWFFGHVDLIKIDTEGCEKFVLEGGEITIRDYKPGILMEYTKDSFRTMYFGYQKEESMQLLKSWGYEHFLPVGNEDLWAAPPLKLTG